MMQQLAASSTELAANAKPAANSQDGEQSTSEFSAMFEQHNKRRSPLVTAPDKKSHSSDNTAVMQNKQGNSDVSKQQNDVVDNKDASQSAKEHVDGSTVQADNTKNNQAETGETGKSDDEIVDKSNQADPLQTESAESNNEQLHTTWLDLLDKINTSAKTKEESDEAEVAEQSQSLMSKLIEKLFSAKTDQQAVADDGNSTETGADNTDDSNIDLEGQLAAATDVNDIDTLLAQLKVSGESADDQDKLEIIDVLAELLKTLQSGPSNHPNLEQISPTTEVDDSAVSELLAELTLKTDAQTVEQNSSQLFDSVDRVLAFLAGHNIDSGKLVNNGEFPTQDIAKLAEDMKSLLAVPKEQLNKALDKLTTQMLPDASTETRQGFIASLQAGINEIRSQLEQGREPALDLQAMVGKVLGELSKNNPELAPASARQSISQVLEFASMTAAHAESTAMQGSGEHNDDTAVRLGETKVVQHNNALDKNITNLQKMEGIKTLVDKVQLMINQKNLVADIRIDPPELGSMQIRLHLGADQASVNFVVQNQQARELLEQSTPRLKEMLAERGIELGQSTVRQEKDQTKGGADQQGSSAGGQLAKDGGDSNIDEQSQTHQLHVTNGALGGIDYFV